MIIRKSGYLLLIRKGVICKSTIRVYGRHVRYSPPFGAMDFVGIL